MAITAFAGLMLVAQVLGGGGAPAQVECTFEHPGFTGTCVEQATPEDQQTPRQACEVILSCLNDARCVRTYCQATTLRGGWSLLSARPVDGRDERQGVSSDPRPDRMRPASPGSAR